MSVFERHGWHAIGELALLVLATILLVVYVVMLVRGRVHPFACPSCGRTTSRSDARCPRCGEPLRFAGP